MAKYFAQLFYTIHQTPADAAFRPVRRGSDGNPSSIHTESQQLERQESNEVWGLVKRSASRQPMYVR